MSDYTTNLESELAGAKDLPRFRRLFLRSTFLGGGAVAIALIVALALTPTLTRVFLPADYVFPVYRFATILFWAAICQAFALGIDSFYVASNQIRTWYILSFVGLLLCLPLAVWLILNVSVAGAAFATVVLNSWLLVIVGYAVVWLSRKDQQVW